MNTENSKTNEPHRFRLDFTDKCNLKNQKQKHGFSQFEYLLQKNFFGKTSSQNIAIRNLKFPQQIGMILLIYLMVLILLWIFKTTLNLSSKNTKR